MNNTKHLADRLNEYFQNKRMGVATLGGEFKEQDASTVKGSIYNKLHARQIEMQKLENQYIKDGKEIDITKASSRIKQLDEKIEATKKAISNFSKSYQEEIEKLQDAELSQEHSVMGRIAIIEKYNRLSQGMDQLPVYQNLTTELNDYNVELYMLQKKVQQFEEENHDIIKAIEQDKRKQKVQEYLNSKV